MTLEILLPQLQNLYGYQSAAIDSGDGTGWASTFTTDGIFDSPSYPKPVRGCEELSAFAQHFPEMSPHTHHIVSNVHLISDHYDDLRASFLIIIVQGIPGKEAQILRIVRATDQLVITDAGLRVQRRTITI